MRLTIAPTGSPGARRGMIKMIVAASQIVIKNINRRRRTYALFKPRMVLLETLLYFASERRIAGGSRRQQSVQKSILLLRLCLLQVEQDHEGVAFPPGRPMDIGVRSAGPIGPVRVVKGDDLFCLGDWDDGQFIHPDIHRLEEQI